MMQDIGFLRAFESNKKKHVLARARFRKGRGGTPQGSSEWWMQLNIGFFEIAHGDASLKILGKTDALKYA